MKIGKHWKLWTILTSASAIMTTMFVVGTVIANKYNASINAYFNLVDYERVEIDDVADLDTEYYKSSFVTKGGNYDDGALFDYDLRVSEQVVSEGSVLLWNENNALPLTDEEKDISLFSNTSVNMVYTGTGSGSINVKEAVNLKTAFEKYKFNVNDSLWNFYETGNGSKDKGYGLLQKGSSGISTNEPLYTKEVPWSVIESDTGVKNSFATYNDAAIYVLGRSGGEGGDLSNAGTSADNDTIGGDYLQLSEIEKGVLDKLIEEKKKGTFSKIVLLINSANAFNFDLINEYKGADKIDSCMWVGQPGAGGTPGIAKLIAGKSSPSGHLVDTYVYDNNSCPAMENFYLNQYLNASQYGLGGTKSAYTVYQEGIYVGYKYYETRYEDVVLNTKNVGNYDYSKTVAYPFGFGLSYTQFEFSNMNIKEDKSGDYEISVDVTNVGSKPGRKAAQVYLQTPYTEYDKTNAIEKASVSLAGYEKTNILQPGEKQTLKIIVDDQELKSYDANGAKTYIREAGDYYFALGNDSHDALNNILEAKSQNGVSVDKSKMVDSLGKAGSGNSSLVKKINFADNNTSTYSKSVHTDAEITNLFDFSDINKYENKGTNGVKYLTRNDWLGTYPEGAPTLVLNDNMVKDLAEKFEIEETKKDAEAFYEKNGPIVYGSKKTSWSLIEMKDLKLDDPTWDELLNQMTFEEQAELCSNGYHTTVAVPSINKPATRDENGPLGISVTFSTMQSRKSMGWPCEPIRAATFNKPLNELMGKCVGEDMLHAGVTGLWGYGLNIHRTAYAGRNFEYYSEDALLSGETCAYETQGAQSKGAFVMVKHFAANDSDTNRHGNNEWMSEQALREIYLKAFEIEFTKGKAKSTMTAYNRLGTTWAGGSYALLTKVLRNEWGFNGYTSSDYAGGTRSEDYDMNSYVGIQAGNDTYDANWHKDEYMPYKDNDLIKYCLRISSKRICQTIMDTAVMNGISPSTKIVFIKTWWQKSLIAIDATFGTLTFAFGMLLALSIFEKRKNKKEVIPNEKA